MPLLRIGVTVLSLVPFTLIENFGQNQCRLDRIERLAFVEHFVIGIRPAAEKIGDNIAGAKLGNNPRTKRVSRPVDRDKPDLGKFFAEFIEQRLRAVAADVEIQPPLLLRGRNRILPSYLPRGLSIRGKQCGTRRDQEEKK